MSEQGSSQKLDLSKVYQFRFAGISQEKKDATWALITRWIESRLENPKSVLDPAAGRGEFIISSQAQERWACDLSDQRISWPTGVTTRFGDIYKVDLPENYFDLIFVSNFLEHLATPNDVYKYLMQLRKSLKPGGKLAIMGPNFRYCAKGYYDFADHLLPLTHRTIEEHLAAAALDHKSTISRFLPLSFRSQRLSHPLLVKLYLAVPIFWRLFGKQFFIVATKPAE
jgi:SAM-dependent methyltransferase